MNYKLLRVRMPCTSFLTFLPLQVLLGSQHLPPIFCGFLLCYLVTFVFPKPFPMSALPSSLAPSLLCFAFLSTAPMHTQVELHGANGPLSFVPLSALLFLNSSLLFSMVHILLTLPCVIIYSVSSYASLTHNAK